MSNSENAESKPRRRRSALRETVIVIAIVLSVLIAAAVFSILNSPEPKIMAPGHTYNSETPREII